MKIHKVWAGPPTEINTIAVLVCSRSAPDDGRSSAGSEQMDVPKLEYALKTTSLDKIYCQLYNTALRKTVVAPTGLNKSYPSTVLYAQAEYEGMEFPNVEYLHNQAQLEYWLIGIHL